ncbi:MAG: hypothetical protein AB7G11_06110 [Phycisphaerales bacterium]
MPPRTRTTHRAGSRPGESASRRAPAEPGAVMELLEARALFAGDFASVGMRFETFGLGNLDGDVLLSEGFIDDSLNVFGDVFSSSNFDRTRVDTLPYDFIEQVGNGRYIRHPDRGSFGTTLESNGARFLDADGFPAGWWYGDFGGGDKEAEFIVERPTSATYSDFVGEWRFSMLTFDQGDEDFDNGYGVLSIDFDDVRFLRDSGRVPHTISSIDVVTDRGRLTTDAGEYFYLSKDKSVLIFADMAEHDGVVSIGVAVRMTPTLSRDQLIGGYLLQWTFADAPASDGPNGEVDFRQRFLNLEADGDYRIWDLDDWDSGNDENEYAISRGFWRLSGDRLILERRDSDDVVVMAVSPNMSTLVPLSLDDGDIFSPVLGLATRAFPDGMQPPPPMGVDPVIAVPADMGGGGGQITRPLVYALGTDDVWEVVDLIHEAGGPTPTGPAVSWIDSKDGHAYAAAPSSIGLVLYSQPGSGTWTYRVLTDEIVNAQPIASAVQVMTAPDGNVTLTGLNSAGELVRYYQTGVRNDFTPEFRWFFSNIETSDLGPQGLETPEFVGPLVSYATTWGGLNVAGLDSSGAIWSVWWAPGLARWTVTNLSQTSGAVPLVGGLAVYLTPWRGINLAGIDSAGNLQVTWWVPQFGGNWAASNLTIETLGPRLRPDSMSTYVAAWGGLNIVGLDVNTSEVRVYWWAPERTSLGWAITTLSTAVPPASPRIVDRPLMGLAAEDNSLNVFGYTAGGSFIRYYWKPGFGGAWQAQDLTLVAVDR